ncbi:MAG TPA: alpha amylase C-terminal domain-containing protein, partial [Streptosporangiaceae bacterium]|nr:alpha amylase C-terminal domain-containing protein [Streptosporangiaceae bacterium]
CVCNFAAMPRLGYRVGLPSAGTWTELLNTDAEVYGGSGVGNFGRVEAVAEQWHGRPASAQLSIPPLGVIWLAPEAPQPVAEPTAP